MVDRAQPTTARMAAVGLACLVVVIAGTVAAATRDTHDTAVTAAATTSTAPATSAPPASTDAPDPSTVETPPATEGDGVGTDVTAPPATVVDSGGDAPVPGPTIEGTAGSYDALRTALTDARARWVTAKPAGGYSFRWTTSCFCPPDAGAITVVDAYGDATTTDMADGLPLAPWTVENMFDELLRHIDANDAAVSAAFDTVYGFPVTYYNDVSRQIADEEVGRTVVWFKVS